MGSPFRSKMLCALIVSGLVVLAPLNADAHVDVAPSKVAAGGEATVTFTINHGCSGSPTSALAVKVPAGVTVTKVAPPKGWVAKIGTGRIDASGTSIAATAKTSLTLRFTAPAASGTLRFPTVQTCEKGELAWIGSDSSKNPAPAVAVGTAKTPPKHNH